MLVTTIPTEEQHQILKETLIRFNEACHYISQIAFEHQTHSQVKVHKLCYYDVREKFGLSSQMAVRAIGKVVESYRADQKPGSFNLLSAIVYDQRNMSVRIDHVSLATLAGRMKIPLIVSGYHQGIMKQGRVKGQADLVLVDHVFYLLLVVDLPEPPLGEPVDFPGVDLGVKNIATDSDGKNYSASHLNSLRYRNFKLRQRLQKKGTKSAKRLLKKRRRKEHRFATDVNHQISRRIVERAKGTGRGIAMEDLTGIRERATVGKSQRRSHHSWAFNQLRQFVTYKALLAGVKLVLVDPRYTSQGCSRCGHVSKKNRPTRDDFKCIQCGFPAPADYNAALNIRSRAAVNQPYAGIVEGEAGPLS
jgi:IS605 OrfB family transposase